MYPPQPPYAPYVPPPRKSRATPLAVFGCGTVLALFLGLAMVVGAFAPDQPADGKAARATVTVTVTQVQAAKPQAKGASAPSAKPTKVKVVKVKVPNMVGRNHQESQDYLQSLGFFKLAEEDATGQGRALIWDRNWVVVRQSPKAGTMADPETVTITLYSKKIGE